MPCDWGASLGAEFRGRVRYERTFHWTAPRADGEELWLVFAGVDAAAQVVLNGEPLGRVEGRSTPYRFEIASRLAAQNRLIVEIECLPQLTAAEERRLRGDRAGLPGGLFGEVRLEITQQGPGSTS